MTSITLNVHKKDMLEQKYLTWDMALPTLKHCSKANGNTEAISSTIISKKCVIKPATDGRYVTS